MYLEGFQSIVDSKMEANELQPYLLNIFYKIVNRCLVRHSKRSSSEQVQHIFIITIIMHIIIIIDIGCLARN